MNTDPKYPGPVGSQIRNLRLERGMTLQDLACAAGTSTPTMHRYEGGWTRFSLTTLRKIAEALNADLEVALVPRHPGQIEPGTGKKSLAGDLVRILSPLFWDKPLKETDVHEYPTWVLRRVLTSGTYDQVTAAVDYFGPEMVRTVIKHRDVDAKTRAFWNAVQEES